MIAEKPVWIRHEGMQIFSVDVEPGGVRFATGGGDHKVRIWNFKSVCRDIESSDSSQRLLATLRDHFGSVNCVRWAKHGKHVASGSDDQVILIHERKPGSGTTEFGSGEPPDVENWKVIMTFRGHTADVVDLNWSPDDTVLASGSLDNTVHIWNMSSGICTAVLKGHSSLVKGVTWDPIGSFIASQSDDKTVIIWRTSDWSVAHRTDGHWSKSLGSTFFRRLGWSPCGHFITTTHGFQKPRHSAPVLERGEWTATFDFLGHNAPVIVVKFNHSMFRRSQLSHHGGKAVAAGWANGDSKTSGKDSAPYNVIAIGSQDRTITVWTTASARPLFVAKHFFSQSVVDLSWSPDGYSLVACSLDGTIATFHFEVNELGFRLSDTELYELKKSRYGDVRGRQADLAESPAQLLLEAASVKQEIGKKPVADICKVQLPLKPSDVEITAKVSGSRHSAKSRNGEATDDLNHLTAVTRRSSPVKQREYRCPDGRKRIIPEAVGIPSLPEGRHTESNVHAVDLPSPGNMTIENGVVHADHIKRFPSPSSYSKERGGFTARAIVSDSLIIERLPGSNGRDGRVEVETAVSKASSSLASCTTNLFIRVFDKKEVDGVFPTCLEARTKENVASNIVGVRDVTSMKETDILCTTGSQTLWLDRILGKVTVLAGNVNFWAVGCEDGSLQIYSRRGRRIMPTMMMGSAAVFIDCDECWKLLLVTKKGSLHVWDLLIRKSVINDSLVSLITSSDVSPTTKEAGTIKIISAKFSKSGSPLVVLSTRHAFIFDMNLMCWLRIADNCFPASIFASSWNYGSAQSSELSTLQVDVRKFLARNPGWSRSTDDGMQTRAHLESQLASSLALQSSNDYRQCLLSYVRFLAREADESRLRELCEGFIGPPCTMKEQAWDSFILGMEKKKLLREDILPAMASNRKMQRLVNELVYTLSEYDDSEHVLGSSRDVAPSLVSPVVSERPAETAPEGEQLLSIVQDTPMEE